MGDLPSRVGYTITFLRMTATEVRRLAEDTPEIARELAGIAEQVQAEAESLAGHIADEQRRSGHGEPMRFDLIAADR